MNLLKLMLINYFWSRKKFNLICIDPKNVPCLFFNEILSYILMFFPPLFEYYLDCHYHY